MPFAPFHELCLDVAQRETRVISVFPAAKLDIPLGRYEFIEMYCNERRCDCRRVFFSVFGPDRQIHAVIAWGWEDQAFYKRWLGDPDPSMAREMQGPVLNRASAQSNNAEVLLELARRVLLVDPAYVARIKRHYALFRSKVDGRGKKAAKPRGRKPAENDARFAASKTSLNDPESPAERKRAQPPGRKKRPAQS